MLQTAPQVAPLHAPGRSNFLKTFIKYMYTKSFLTHHVLRLCFLTAILKSIHTKPKGGCTSLIFKPTNRLKNSNKQKAANMKLLAVSAVICAVAQARGVFPSLCASASFHGSPVPADNPLSGKTLKGLQGLVMP